MKEYATIELLKKLVSYDTTSWKSNLALIEFLVDYLRQYNISPEVIYNADRTKANLLATIGPVDRPGIILSGHTDVVPVTGQDWSHDPFDMHQCGDRLYGRGTADMKGFVACVLAAVPAFARADLTEPLHLAFSYDEETGCTGVISLIEHIQAMAIKPRACIVGEPTGMKVVNSHKGIFHLLTRVYGLEAHSSTDRGVNAVMYAADMISFLSGLAREMRDRTPAINGFDPPYTTVHVGRIKGGIASNITPSYCEFEWDVRPLPGAGQDEILTRFDRYVADDIVPAMQARAPGYGRVETEILVHVPSLLPESGASVETLVLALANQNDVAVVSYGTEAGIFQTTGGVPTVVCGPGSILQAHRPDEYIDVSQLAQCDAFLGRLLTLIKNPD
ncbi:MAG: acetylornithine deacetylase [Alphaproteobacteria bacterium]|nr:acetylornithine deacetylase [Alphaproteobacteria bacterium]